MHTVLCTIVQCEIIMLKNNKDLRPLEKIIKIRTGSK